MNYKVTFNFCMSLSAQGTTSKTELFRIEKMGGGERLNSRKIATKNVGYILAKTEISCTTFDDYNVQFRVYTRKIRGTNQPTRLNP